MTEKERKNVFKSGMVSIVGRPNTGKSTLLNAILEEKVAIVSRVPQTTRNQIRGIYNDEQSQIVFIDTPGLHLGRDKLDKYMNLASSSAIDDVDCLIYLVDTSRRIGDEEKNIAEKIKNVSCPVVLGLNKVDLKADYMADYIAFWEQMKGMPVGEMKNFSMVALSGREDKNVKTLIEVVQGFLPEGAALYPRDVICDVPQRMAVADVIREKLFQSLQDEIPHSLGVVIEELRPAQKKPTRIKALIFVERQTQKEIVIGKNGRMLKKIGTLARLELEDLLESKVFLELRVKVQDRWRDNILFLQDLGYQSQF